MNTTYLIYIGIFMVVFYAGFYSFMNLKKKKQKELLANTDFNAELNKAEQHLQSYIRKELPFLKEQMGDKTIDALNFASANHTTKDAFKDGVKDGLKGLATLGTVKFQTIQTPKYLVLSGADLHLLDTDVDGDFSDHLIFDAFRLEKSSITEILLKGTMKGYAKQKGENTKGYQLLLATDGDHIELNIFSALLFSNANNGVSVIGSSAKKDLQENIIGNHFLKQLGDKYPNLKVPIPLLS